MEDEDYSSFYPEESRAPESVFPHAVEALDSGIREGMIVEVPVDSSSSCKSKSCFWLAKIQKVFGPLLECVYVSPETESGRGIPKAFWISLSRNKSKVFPLGYCQSNKFDLRPPAVMLNDGSFDWEEVSLRYLEDVTYDTVDMHFMEPSGGINPAERLQPGMVLDVRDRTRPQVYWSAVIHSNNAGLLTLSYDAPESNLGPFQVSLFYLSDRLMRCNLKDRKRIFEPPDFIKSAFKSIKWKDFRTKLGSLDRPNPPMDLINSKKVDSSEQDSVFDYFEEESLVEVVHPGSSQTLELGVIDQVEKNLGVVVKLFRDPKVKILRSPIEVFPVGWSQSSELNGARSASLENKLPAKYSLALKKCFSRHNASDYKTGQLLEALYEESLHIGKIVGIKEPLLWIELIEHPSKKRILVHTSEYSLFPLGWAFANNLPVANVPMSNTLLAPKPEPSPALEVKSEPHLLNPNSSWVEAIYINCKCSSVGFLSKKRLLSLPKSVGPGSVRLVLREVLSKLIGMSFKSGSVLKRLEYDDAQPRRKSYCLESLKGKSKVLHLKGYIEIPTLLADVDDYCREVCSKVGACPYLISRKLYEDACPAVCKAMDIQVGRPKKKRQYPFSLSSSVSHSNANNRNSHGNSHNPDDSSPSSLEETDDNASRNNSRCVSPEPRKKHSKREWSELLPKSDIQTRGAKIPNWKVHLKIRPSKKDQNAINNSALNKFYTSNLSKRFKQLEPAFRVEDIPKTVVQKVEEGLLGGGACEEEEEYSFSELSCDDEESLLGETASDASIRLVRLRRDPTLWSPGETAAFLAQTLDCAHLARFMYEDQIDGPAFLLLNFPTVKEYWSLKNDTAVQLCQHVESVKLAYVNKFFDESTTTITNNSYYNNI